MGTMRRSATKVAALLRHHTRSREARQIAIAVRRIEAARFGTPDSPLGPGRGDGRAAEPMQTGFLQFTVH